MIVGVIGSGSIGPDLAYGFVSALAQEKGARVFLHDIQQDALDAGVARIRGYVRKGVSRGKLTASTAEKIEEALVPTLQLSDLADCDYVLEAATERLPIKRQILRNVEETVTSSCLIGFATSGIPRAEIAVDAIHPERCFVNHPFYPAWRALPVEVVLSGDDALGERMLSTLRRLGKVPVVTADVACFAADDIFCNYVSEAARLVEEGVASAAQVDRIVNDAIGGGGPLNVMDLTRGNLLTAHCQELMRDAATGSDWFDPPAILSERGSALWHEPGDTSESSYDAALQEQVLGRILAVLFGRTYFVVDHDICAPGDLDWMTRTALGFRTGILTLADEYGAERVQAICTRYAASRPDFYVPPSIREGRLEPFRRNVRMTSANGVATVCIQRPEVMNALDAVTMRELSEVFDELASDDALKGVILTGYNGALVGADISELANLKTQQEGEEIGRKGHAVLRRIECFSKPVVAVLNGPVMGGGAELSMACHARIVGSRVTVSQPEVNLGIIPGYGGTQRLPRIVGWERALEMLRLGRPIDAETACAWGWAEGAVASDPIAAAEQLIAAHWAGSETVSPVGSAPMNVPAEWPYADLGHRSRTIDAILVDVLRRGLACSLEEGLAIEAEGVGRAVITVDFDIGMKNFAQNGPRVPAMFLHE